MSARPACVALWLLSLTAEAQAHTPISTPITWHREIVRIFARYCGSCHRPAGSSFSLATYEEARPWARAIKEEVEERRMPPWPPARGVGDFANDRSLPPRLIDLVVAWVEGGAPEGDRVDSPRTAGERDPPPSTSWPASLSPGERAIELRGSIALRRATDLLAVQPLARHGDRVEVRALFPDGGRETLVYVPRFDPRYLFAYQLRRPLTLPVGTRLEVLPPRARAQLLIRDLSRTGAESAPPSPTR